MKIFKKIKHSLWLRIMGSFFLLPIIMSLMFVAIGYFSFDTIVSKLVETRMEPMIEALIKTAEDGGSAETMAKRMGVKIYSAPNIPKKYRSVAKGLYNDDDDLFEMKEFAYVGYSNSGKQYVIIEKIKTIEKIGENLADTFWWAVVISLLITFVVGVLLCRHLVSPLVKLSKLVSSGKPLSESLLTKRHDEVGDLANAFAHREEELQTFLQREQMFTGDVSHELRTPLTVMQSGIEIIDGELANATPAVKSLIDRIQRNLHHMAATVQTLLLLARKPEALDSKEILIAPIVKDRVGDYEGKDIQFICDDDNVMVKGDIFLTDMIVRNLLDNAEKYSQNTPVIIQMSQRQISFSNGGLSIPTEVRGRLFDKRHRGDRSNKGSQGSGLGLSLVSRACEQMGWTIEYTPIQGGGNTFTVKFY